MLISDLLNNALQCKTERDVQAVMQSLTNPLEDALRPMVMFQNPDYYMQPLRPMTTDFEEEAYFYIELASPLSPAFFLQQTLELTHGELLLSSSTLYMKDRLGFSSRDWEEYEGEAPWKIDPSFKVQDLIVLIRGRFKYFQAKLLRDVGVDPHIAEHLVENDWEALSTPADIHDEAKANAQTLIAEPNPLERSCCVAILPTGDWAGVESEDDVQFVHLTEWQMSALNGLTENMILKLDPNMTEENINDLIFEWPVDNETMFMELGGKL